MRLGSMAVAVIVRVFRGQVRPGMGPAFERFVRDRALPQLRSRPGMLSAHLGLPTPATPDEYMVITVWRDLESLRAFAGPDWDRVVVGPDEARLLARSWVHHARAANGDGAVDLPEAEEPWSRGLRAGGLTLDLVRRVARVNGRDVEIPPREFAVLVELALHAGEPIPSAELARRAWPNGDAITGDDVRRAIYRLRLVLGDHGRPQPLIRNRRGYGYVLARR
jgi:heme-degrading monooxygenase HmoA